MFSTSLQIFFGSVFALICLFVVASQGACLDECVTVDDCSTCVGQGNWTNWGCVGTGNPCSIVSCVPGYGDCDGVASNGCETVLIGGNCSISGNPSMLGAQPLGNISSHPGPFWTLTFDISPIAPIVGYASIFRVTNNQDYSRYPGLFFAPSTFRLYVDIRSTSGPYYDLQSEASLILPPTYVTRVRVEHGNSLLIFYNDTLVGMNAPGTPFTYVPGVHYFYLGDPWYTPANVNITNLTWTVFENCADSRIGCCPSGSASECPQVPNAVNYTCNADHFCKIDKRNSTGCAENYTDVDGLYYNGCESGPPPPTFTPSSIPPSSIIPSPPPPVSTTTPEVMPSSVSTCKPPIPDGATCVEGSWVFATLEGISGVLTMPDEFVVTNPTTLPAGATINIPGRGRFESSFALANNSRMNLAATANITIGGNFSLATSSHVSVDVNVGAASNFRVSGTVQLSGNLEVNLSLSASVNVNEIVLFETDQIINGVFNDAILALGEGECAEVEYLPTKVLLNFVAPGCLSEGSTLTTSLLALLLIVGACVHLQ